MATNRCGRRGRPDDVDRAHESTRDVVAPTPVAALHATLDHPVEAGARRHRRCRRCGTGSTSCRCTGSPSSGPDGHAERGGFLPAGAAAAPHVGRRPLRRSAARCASVTTWSGRRPSRTSCPSRAAPARWCSSPCGTRCRATARATRRWSSTTTSSTAPRRQPGEVEPPPTAAASGAAWQRDGRPGRRAAVPLLGADLQRPPHPLRPPLRHRGRGLPGSRSSTGRCSPRCCWTCCRRNAPDADVATFRFRAVRPTFDLHPFQVNGEPRPTAPSACGPRTTRAG